MKRPAVRCRCGHQVLAKEVLRTDLYERPSGREYVYVKYRCKRCKRVGETFVAENRWDWRIFEAPQTEMSEAEADAFADKSPISSEDLLDFHCLLEDVSTAEELASCEEQLRNNILTEIARNDQSSDVVSPDATEESAPGSTPDSKMDMTTKHPRIEPKRGDFKCGNDGLKSNPDPETKKENKKDANPTGGPEDGTVR
jgi:DNA-directed RNA polymerase subunit RPC12/RpoP